MRALALGLVVIALVVSGCSGGGGSSAPAERATPPAPRDRLRVNAIEFEYDQPSWAVPAGRPFTVEFDNHGTIAHEWAVLKHGVTLHEQRSLREEMVLFEIEALPEGRSHTQTFTLREPGHYQVVCALEGHFDAGMTSDLTVVAT